MNVQGRHALNLTLYTFPYLSWNEVVEFSAEEKIRNMLGTEEGSSLREEEKTRFCFRCVWIVKNFKKTHLFICFYPNYHL